MTLPRVPVDFDPIAAIGMFDQCPQTLTRNPVLLAQVQQPREQLAGRAASSQGDTIVIASVLVEQTDVLRCVSSFVESADVDMLSHAHGPDYNLHSQLGVASLVVVDRAEDLLRQPARVGRI